MVLYAICAGRGKGKPPPGGDLGVTMETSMTSSTTPDSEEDSDHDLSEFVPPVTPEVKASVAMATLSVPDSDEETTGLTPLGGATPERSPSPTYSDSHLNSDLSDTELQGKWTTCLLLSL